jgi:hypothetical protein
MCSPLHVLQTLLAVSYSAASSCFLQWEGGSTSGCFASCKSYQAQAFYITKVHNRYCIGPFPSVMAVGSEKMAAFWTISLTHVFHTVMEWDSNHKDCGAWKLYSISCVYRGYRCQNLRNQLSHVKRRGSEKSNKQ